MFPDLSNIIRLNFSIASKKNDTKELPFRNGETIKGLVIRKYSERELLVSVRGREFRANTLASLREGKTYHFQVNKTASKTELKVAGGMQQRSGISAPTLDSPSALRSHLTSILMEILKIPSHKGLNDQTAMYMNKLRQISPMMVYSDPARNDGFWLSEFVRVSGLFWENKVLQYLIGEKSRSLRQLSLSDLKGLLLSLDRSLESEGSDKNNIQSLAARIKQALVIIEHEQLLNLTSLREGLGWFFVIPGYPEKGFKHAEVSLETPEKEKGFSFRIALEFTLLGKMDIEVCIVESKLGMHIQMDDAEKAYVINENIHLLKNGLYDLGFTISSIRCDVKEWEGEEKSLSPVEKEQPPMVDIMI